MRTIELLAPAGDLECLETALYFGADAVYVGGPMLQLRAANVGLTMAQLAQAVETAHHAGRKLYVTVNCFAQNEEISEAGPYARELSALGADAVIVSDLGLISEIRKAAPSLPIHVSTQANCCNYAAAQVYHALGVSRIVLAREMTLSDIAELRRQVPKELELETFVHGAMCMAYSGRCMISAYLTGRSGNRGACAQPCRWRYTLQEETRPGEYFPVWEDERGTALLSSRDLCAISFLDRLAEAGVTSFKIEGRMKSPFYVATVVRAYRQALDALARGEMPDLPTLFAELHTVSHRTFSRGFYFGEIPSESAADDGYAQDCVFAGVVRAAEPGFITFEQRNRIRSGDRVEILSPSRAGDAFTMGTMTDPQGLPTDDARLPAALYRAACPFPLSPGDILRLRRSKTRT